MTVLKAIKIDLMSDAVDNDKKGALSTKVYKARGTSISPNDSNIYELHFEYPEEEEIDKAVDLDSTLYIVGKLVTSSEMDSEHLHYHIHVNDYCLSETDFNEFIKTCNVDILDQHNRIKEEKKEDPKPENEANESQETKQDDNTNDNATEAKKTWHAKYTWRPKTNEENNT